MKDKSLSIQQLLAPYGGRLMAVVFLNLFSVFSSILSLLMIDPLMSLLFPSAAAPMSPVLAFLHSFLPLPERGTAFSIFILLIVCFLLLYFLKDLFLILSQWVLAPVRSGVVRDLRDKMYAKILLLPLSYFSTQRKGDIISKGINEIQELEFTMLKSVQQALSEPVTIALYLLTLFCIDVKFTLLVLLLLPLAGLLIGMLSKTLRRRSVESKRFFGHLISHLEESIQGIRIIKASNAEKFSRDLFGRYNTQFTTEQRKIYRRVDLASPVSEFLGVAMVMVILCLGGLQVLHHQPSLSPGMFVAYIAIFIQIINPAKLLATAYSNYKRGLSTLDRIGEILQAEEIIMESDKALPVDGLKEGVLFDHISFRYSGEWVIRDFTLSLRKGEMVALVGPSGAGKSTLVDLLFRFYDVSSGAILLDGVNIKNYKIDDLRSLFGLVSQDVVLFNDTIYNNITFGKTHFSFEEVERAAKISHAYDFISTMPEGFSMRLGDQGLTLSGGQRQRLSIARAVLHNAPVLILDEATSALDTESEKLVQAAINGIVQEKTTLVIAHRLSTIQHADKIVYVEKGRVVEQGTHKELLDLDGKYAKMIKITQRTHVEEQTD